MSKPIFRAIPRFAAEPPREGLPTGRWADVLREHFVAACRDVEEVPEGAESPGEIRWFSERSWGARVYVPATARASSPEGEIEYFGHVSFERGEGGGPTGFRAAADFTDVLAEANPDWRIDLNDEVIAEFHGSEGLTGDMTLIWGRPMVPGAVAATAEVDGEIADQVRLEDDRFTLVALDAVKGLGDELYVTVKLWGKRGQALASETLYEDAEPEEEEPSTLPAGPDSSAG